MALFGDLPGGDSGGEATTIANGSSSALLSLFQLNWFIRLRWIFVAAAVAYLQIERLVQPEWERPIGLYATVIALAGINAIWMIASYGFIERLSRSKAPRAPATRTALVFADVQVAVDLVILTILLRFSGGVENPICIFYVFHIAIGSLLLPTAHAFGQALLAVLLYATLGLGESAGWISPHYSLLPMAEIGSLRADWARVSVAVTAVALGVFGTLHFTQTIAQRVRMHERELAQANAALLFTQRRLLDVQARRARFMQTAAHQLKTPLAVVQTLVNLIRDGVVTGVAMHETCEKIARRCREGIEQVGELLVLARVEGADPADYRAANCDARAVVEKLVRRFTALASAKAISLRLVIESDRDCRVRICERDLSDCVANLIDNAVKYTDAPGDVSVRINRALGWVAPDSADDWVTISVQDTGWGIEAEALCDQSGNAGTVFDAFRRGDRALAAGIPGTGLGLAIVLEVVEKAGGTIHVDSKPGRGTRIAVRIPAADAALRSAAVSSSRTRTIVIEPVDEPNPLGSE